MMHHLPTYCSASEIFTVNRVPIRLGFTMFYYLWTTVHVFVSSVSEIKVYIYIYIIIGPTYMIEMNRVCY